MLVGIVLSVFVAGGAVGAILLGDVGETPCYQVQEESVPVWERLFAPENDQVDAADELAGMARRHPGCFKPEQAGRLARLAKEGPPRIGVLVQARGEDDEWPVRGVSNFVTDEARLAQRTEVGPFYVAPRSTDVDDPEVCLVLVADGADVSTSCARPGASSIRGSDPYPVILRMGGLPHVGWLAGIVADGQTQVLVAGITVPVENNVFFLRNAPADADIELPD